MPGSMFIITVVFCSWMYSKSNLLTAACRAGSSQRHELRGVGGAPFKTLYLCIKVIAGLCLYTLDNKYK